MDKPLRLAAVLGLGIALMVLFAWMRKPLVLEKPSQDDVPALIDRFRSESVKDREAASATLLKMGRAVIPELEGALGNPDAEVRGHALAILTEFERRKRVRAFRPQRPGLTVDLQDVPFPEAVRKIFFPFGVTKIKWDFDLDRRRVSVRLEEASLWEAYKAFCAAARARPKQLAGLPMWYFKDEEEFWLSPARAHSDVGNVRFTAGGGAFMRSGDGQWQSIITLQALLPPRAHASSWKMTEMQILDQKGRRIEARMESLPEGWQQRRLLRPSLLTPVKLWRAIVHPERLLGVTSLRLKGVLTLRYPRQLEAVQVELIRLLGEGKLPVTIGAGGAGVEIITEPHIDDYDRWTVRLNAAGRGADVSFLTWVEDKRGRWLFDTGSFEAPESSTRAYVLRGFTVKGSKPDRLVLNRIVEEGESKINIDLKGLRVLPSPPRVK